MSLEKLKKEVNKQYNTELMIKGSKIRTMQRWSSGSLALDFELGGGLPTGKIITYVGAYSDGKTSLVLKAVAEYQKEFPDKEILWVDAEGCWEDVWSRTLGVDPDGVWVVRPEFQQQAFDIINKAIEYDVGLVVVDSVAALVPKEEAEASYEDWNIGLAARINSKAMRGFQSTLNSRSTENVPVPPTIILINQLRDAIGQYKPESEPGGRAIGFHSAIKIYLRKGDYYPKPKTNYVGASGKQEVVPKAQQIKFFIEKNKTAPARKASYTYFYFDTLDELRPKGCIDQVEEIFRYALAYEVVIRRGKYYDVLLPDGGYKTIMGSATAADFLRTNGEVWEFVKAEVMNRIEKSYTRAAEKQEVDDSEESATDEAERETGSKEDGGTIDSWFGLDSVGEAGSDNKFVASAAQANGVEVS